MTTVTNHDGTGNQQSNLYRLIHAAGALTTMLAAGGILVLALTGHADVIPVVAGLGAAGLAGAAPITINIIRNAKQH
ncbi:hypothetical protein OG894_45290 (plasmid) [Streptomyces sp. NBC_01724]|uniref:hypothetical protein n=1 Tax=unclassified Streptomyces TaxID=2593676 RepID=UPI002E326A4C|nr:hypothetical protein [Streptomyces sp. NBC_01724]